MAKKGSKKRTFKGLVSRNAQKQSQGVQFGHLDLPKSVQAFKEEPGARMRLDIVPYEVTTEYHPDRDDEYGIAVPGSLWYKRPFWLHRSVGAQNESLVCPKSINQPCPICEYRGQLLKDGVAWNDDTVRALKPSMRNLYAVIPRGEKNYEEKVYIWDIAQFLFQDKLNEEIQENEEYETFPDLENGLTLRIRFAEEVFGTYKFASTSRIDFMERESQYDESLLSEIPSLDKVLVVKPYKAIAAMFFGGVEEEEAEEEEAEEEEEETTPPAARPRQRRTADKEAKGTKEETTSAKKESPVCPYGHTYGKDTDEFEDCDDCDLWEDCIDALGEGGP